MRGTNIESVLDCSVKNNALDETICKNTRQQKIVRMLAAFCMLNYGGVSMQEQETILIADDAEINRAVLHGLFEREYNLLEAENGEQALMLLNQYSETITAVLLDLVMPEKNGYEVLEELQAGEHLFHIPVIVITADDSTDSKVRVFKLGASDIITKPFDPDIVQSRVRNIIELARYRRHLEALVEEHAARARESNTAIIDMLSSVIEHRNLESGQHIRRIRMFTKILLEHVAKNYQEYGLNERKIRLITDASSMHDIGKIAIPDRILNKNSMLTSKEFEVMKTHTVKGCEILSGLDRLQEPEYLQYAYDICRYHHERWDGNGYPDGLKENNIPLCAQVVAIADCYDALTSDRVYKKAVPPYRAFSMILNGECGVFSPRLLECFKSVQNAFAQLSRDYADGLPPETKPEERETATTPAWDIADSTLEQSQLKYFALLRYLDSTVMEVDLQTEIYHLVYLADQDFVALRSGESFAAAIRAFAESSVHPDDREEVLRLLTSYIDELFEEGLTKRERSYRVLERESNTYVWCRASLLRTNLENPRRRRMLMVWRKEKKKKKLPASPVYKETSQNGLILDQLLGGVQKCRNDQYFTLLQINRGLVDLLGYSEEEISDNFQNHFVDMLYPADRKKIITQFREQRNSGKALELEYRLVTKDGNIVWVSDRCILVEENGEEVLYCVLLDVTRSHHAEEALRLSLERHRIIMNQTNDIIFEWDIKADRLHFSSKWEDQYGYVPITENVRTMVPKLSHINPDDMPQFIELMDAMASGMPYKETEFRIADAKGVYRWRKARATAQFDVDGKPFKAVGVMVDIDSQKKASAELQKRATRDVLTGLYNKASAKERVERHLGNCPQGDLSALMVLDADDFKQINDHYGHMFGDAVLVKMASKIAALFRGNDTVARIGGDEYMIFMPNICKEEIASQRADELIRVLNVLLLEDVGEVAFSCSIGLAFARSGAIGYQELFNQADRALYRAKAAGKNQSMSYHEDMEGGPVGVLANTSFSLRTEIDSNESERWNLSHFVMKTFGILYSATDFPQAVQSILAMTGAMFGVSRTYIFETLPGEEPIACNTFEWCADGITPQKNMLQKLSYIQNGKDYRENFNGDGVFYCQNVGTLPRWQRTLLETQGVLSVLQCAIREGNSFRGMVGFDDCSIYRMWTRDQIDALTFVGRLLSTFLLKDRATEALADSLQNLHSVLDHQEVWLYVLDPVTYQLRYINGKTKELVPDAEPGLPCYKVFYHRDKPCENCVMECSRKTGQSTMEIYNPTLDLWLLTDASMVDWARQKACLVTCRNISAYKKQVGEQS